MDITVTRRHKRAPMSGNSKHSKNNFKINVMIFGEKNLCGGCTDNIVFFYVQLINHHIYIYIYYTYIYIYILNYAVI